MGNAFDFGVEQLIGKGTGADAGNAAVSATGSGTLGHSDEAAGMAHRLRRRALAAKKREKRIAAEASAVVDQDLDASTACGAPQREKQIPGDARIEAAGAGKKTSAGEERAFYLETFGCQMNDHDSEKVAGVLLARGYTQVEKPEAASVILYNTCSIREKAAQKVFSRLGEWRPKEKVREEWNAEEGRSEDRPLQTGRRGPIIGVLGCVAQQEGEEIFARAPWVSLVCGSASYRKLPEMIAQLEAGNTRITGLETDTDETFETEMTRRDNPW